MKKSVENFIDRLNGMLSPDDREESHRIQDKEERTGDTEEIAHHEVRRPGGLELGKTVEHIKRVQSLLLNDVMDIHRKGFKAVRQRDPDCFDFRTFFYQRFMACKAEIDDIPAVLLRLPDIWVHKQPELRKIRYPPHHVVA